MTDSAESIVVVKVGGDVLLDDEERQGLGANIRQLVDDGHRVVVLHGGGPQVSALQEKLGMTPKKVGGRRVTSLEDLRVVQQAICGEVNVALTSALLQAGVRAFGCHGASGQMVQATKRPPKIVAEGGDEPVDFGEVGDVVRIDATLIRGLLDLALVPVVATLGVTPGDGRVFNINADTTATRMAQSLGASALLLVTKIGGVFRDLSKPETRYERLEAAEARKLIEEGIIAGGMIPKVEEALEVLERGVSAIAVVGAREPGSFLRVVRNEGGCGTRIATEISLPG